MKMNSEQLILKFKECEFTRSYKRIDVDHPVDIYVGYNVNGCKTLAIIAKGDIENVESTRLISVNVFKRNDGKLNLSFSLLDDTMSDIFYQFCNDIIFKTTKIDNVDAISYIINRWKSWIKVFKNPCSIVMSENEVRGLLGELIFLKEFMFEKYGIEKGLISWVGSSMAHKDFEINDTWYEVKSVRENALMVEISSVEQLESNVYGELVMVILEPSNMSIEQPILLNSYIKDIENMLENKEEVDLFYEKLEQRNYIYEDEYDKYVYSMKGIDKYSIVKDFPRILKSELKSGIERVKYYINIEHIREYKL